jgi:hypothetical protein
MDFSDNLISGFFGVCFASGFVSYFSLGFVVEFTAIGLFSITF